MKVNTLPYQLFGFVGLCLGILGILVAIHFGISAKQTQAKIARIDKIADVLLRNTGIRDYPTAVLKGLGQIKNISSGA